MTIPLLLTSSLLLAACTPGSPKTSNFYEVGAIAVGKHELIVAADSSEHTRSRTVTISRVIRTPAPSPVVGEIVQPERALIVDQDGKALPVNGRSAALLGVRAGGRYRLTYGKRLPISSACGMWDLVEAEVIEAPPEVAEKAIVPKGRANLAMGTGR